MVEIDQEMVNLGVRYDSSLAQYVDYADGPFNKFLRSHAPPISMGVMLIFSAPMFLALYFKNATLVAYSGIGFVFLSLPIIIWINSAKWRYRDTKSKLQDLARIATADLCREVVRRQTGKLVNVKAVVVDEGEDGVAAYADFKMMLLSLRYYPTSQLFVSSVESRYGSDVEYEDYDLMQLVKRVYESEILPQLNILHIGVVAD